MWVHAYRCIASGHDLKADVWLNLSLVSSISRTETGKVFVFFAEHAEEAPTQYFVDKVCDSPETLFEVLFAQPGKDVS